MKRVLFLSALALSTLCFTMPAHAENQPPLPKAAATFDAGSMRVDVYGSPGKPAVVFIPGLGCGPWEWSREIALYMRDYSVYAITLPGLDGRAAIQGPLFQTVSADFWTMLQEHGINKPILVGHSLGGTLAIDLAEQHADRLRGVVAVDGLPIFPGFEKVSTQQRAAAASRIGSMFSSITTPQQFELAEKTYALPMLMTSPNDIAAAAALVAKSDPQATGAWMQEDLANDLRAALKNITVPLLEVAPYDALTQAQAFGDAAHVQAYYASLLAGDPTAKVTVVANSRHFVMYDQPQALDQTLTAFLHSVL